MSADYTQTNKIRILKFYASWRLLAHEREKFCWVRLIRLSNGKDLSKDVLQGLIIKSMQ